MLLSDMWIWGARANNYTEDKFKAWMDELANDIPGEAENDLIVDCISDLRKIATANRAGQNTLKAT
jgi:hypothetical protein